MLDIAIYSLPGETQFSQFVQQDNGAAKFYLKSFQKNFRTHVFQGKAVKTSLENLDIELSKHQDAESQMTPSFHEQMVLKGIEFSKAFGGKIVLSRWQDFEVAFNVKDLLQKLRLKFPNAFIYVVKFNDEVWLGATPETLVVKEKSSFKTMSLAGTKWENQPFEEKEFEEQSVVTESILEKLKNYHPSATDAYEYQYGAIRHLRSDIAWNASASLLEIGEVLHPTPAICGHPEELSYQKILELEQYNRGLYTGFIGVEDVNENGQLFVNLRCMQLFRDRIRFYAGGGVNAKSIPSVEWEETNRKMNSVLEVLSI